MNPQALGPTIRGDVQALIRRRTGSKVVTGGLRAAYEAGGRAWGLSCQRWEESTFALPVADSQRRRVGRLRERGKRHGTRSTR
jgi:hypothetical protein